MAIDVEEIAHFGIRSIKSVWNVICLEEHLYTDDHENVVCVP